MSVRNRVAIVGAGVIKFGELFEKGFFDMMVEAYSKCLASVDNGIDPKEIQAVWYGTTGGPGTGSAVAQALGLLDRPITRVENACATGSDAFRNACFATASGLYDVALVIGAEKMLDRPGGLIAAMRERPPYPWSYALTMPTAFALFYVRHMHEFGTTREHLAMVSVKNHKHGAMNPLSHFRKEITVDTVLNSPIISWPFTLYDCCPVTDGAAALIITKAELAKKYTDSPVYVLGSGLSTDPLYVHQRRSFTSFPCVIEASRQAYRMAGVGPEDIDVAEVHDCFTGTELICYEDNGFCKKGEGGKFIEEGIPVLGAGKPVVNPSGGLKSHGHPIAATGVAQLVELFWQLRNDIPAEAGGSKRQVKDARIGLQQNVGGAGPQVCCTNILSSQPR